MQQPIFKSFKLKQCEYSFLSCAHILQKQVRSKPPACGCRKALLSVVYKRPLGCRFCNVTVITVMAHINRDKGKAIRNEGTPETSHPLKVTFYY